MGEALRRRTRSTPTIEDEPSDDDAIPLNNMRRGQHGIVQEIHGGEVLTRRISSMGIRPGARITKISTMLLGGPIIVSINRRHVALGTGMAQKIFVALIP